MANTHHNTHASNTTLFKIDPSRNMRRYYNTDIQPNLFGGHSLIRTWGRIDTTTQTRIQLFDTKKEANNAREKILRQKRQRGYGSLKDAK